MRLELKQVDEQGHFSGYASVFGVVDNQNDLMQHGAFQQTISQGAHGIKLLWQHNFDEPIGIFTLMREDAYGLYVEGTLLLDVQRAKEAHALLKAGAIAGLSIGYVPVNWHIAPETGVRVLEEVALYEVSLVTFPANDQARVSRVKADELEEMSSKADWRGAMRNGDFIRISDALDRAIGILVQV